MKMQEVRELAKGYNLKTSRISKLDLIKEIQLSEGNFDCFASAIDGDCDQTKCIWREDCFESARKLRN